MTFTARNDQFINPKAPSTIPAKPKTPRHVKRVGGLSRLMIEDRGIFCSGYIENNVAYLFGNDLPFIGEIITDRINGKTYEVLDTYSLYRSWRDRATKPHYRLTLAPRPA